MVLVTQSCDDAVTETHWRKFEEKLARLAAAPEVRWMTNLELVSQPSAGGEPTTARL
ncbi:MAG: hypothetical protein PCFJNLEI_00954 [Verrucomicrobiae bacterium]|nr:hypothetical protein [Verrucomicrobiae bacterium]